jgi:hypothetical protein
MTSNVLCTGGVSYARFIIAVDIKIVMWKGLCGPKWHSFRWLQFQGPKNSRFSRPIPSNGRRNGFARVSYSEPVFVNVYGAQESISPAYVAWRAGTKNRVVVRQARNRFLGPLKGLQIRALKTLK